MGCGGGPRSCALMARAQDAQGLRERDRKLAPGALGALRFLSWVCCAGQVDHGAVPHTPGIVKFVFIDLFRLTF